MVWEASAEPQNKILFWYDICTFQPRRKKANKIFFFNIQFNCLFTIFLFIVPHPYSNPFVFYSFAHLSLSADYTPQEDIKIRGTATLSLRKKDRHANILTRRNIDQSRANDPSLKRKVSYSFITFVLYSSQINNFKLSLLPQYLDYISKSQYIKESLSAIEDLLKSDISTYALPTSYQTGTRNSLLMFIRLLESDASPEIKVLVHSHYVYIICTYHCFVALCWLVHFIFSIFEQRCSAYYCRLLF